MTQGVDGGEVDVLVVGRRRVDAACEQRTLACSIDAASSERDVRGSLLHHGPSVLSARVRRSGSSSGSRLAALLWTHVAYPLVAIAVARVRPRRIAKGGGASDGHGRRRGIQRGDRDRASHREPPRARLSARVAGDRRLVRCVVGSDRGDRVAVPRCARRSEPARRKGCRAGPRGASNSERDRRVLGRELHLVARCAAEARASVRRPGRRLRLRSAPHPAGRRRQQGRSLLALRDGCPSRGVGARLRHRRQRLDLRGAHGRTTSRSIRASATTCRSRT